MSIDAFKLGKRIIVSMNSSNFAKMHRKMNNQFFATHPERNSETGAEAVRELLRTQPPANG